MTNRFRATTNSSCAAPPAKTPSSKDSCGRGFRDDSDVLHHDVESAVEPGELTHTADREQRSADIRRRARSRVVAQREALALHSEDRLDPDHVAG